MLPVVLSAKNSFNVSLPGNFRHAFILKLFSKSVERRAELVEASLPLYFPAIVQERCFDKLSRTFCIDYIDFLNSFTEKKAG
ncbi:hypothetical protein [Hymenobacter elongatus]|uniref:Uncharacterized protein n=1 Tax=Hymenobacter elongatus TaxID=877208 RepID=A0A4Z0PHJ9_9BACT|nr:hypothetical protein [Hymenobacter elongatus]TGE14228.1 hypothetical protein E5J99_17070 [Hymenobacter elongatus]